MRDFNQIVHIHILRKVGFFACSFFSTNPFLINIHGIVRSLNVCVYVCELLHYNKREGHALSN